MSHVRWNLISRDNVHKEDDEHSIIKWIDKRRFFGYVYINSCYRATPASNVAAYERKILSDTRYDVHLESKGLKETYLETVKEEELNNS